MGTQGVETLIIRTVAFHRSRLRLAPGVLRDAVVAVLTQVEAIEDHCRRRS
jgi:hypothetical protein